MPPRYQISQKVTITPVNEQALSARNSELSQYVGLMGEITNYYSITPPTGEVLYLYTVRIGRKEIVLHEDEIELVPNDKSGRRSPKAR